MATSNKVLNDKLRNSYFNKVKSYFENDGEEVLQIASNIFCMPVCDDEKNDKFIEIVVKVPTGSKDEPDFDGYGLAEAYTLSQKMKAEKKAETEKKKAEKIARDKALREAKKKEKAE